MNLADVAFRANKIGILFCVFFVGLVSSAHASNPNIVLVIADDQNWRDSGVYGNPDVKTPSIDRLASEGIRFNYAFTGTAMCSTTRQQLYTGIYPIKNGGYPNGSLVYEGVQSLVQQFSKLGYRVGISGKRHIGPRESFPFEIIGDKRENKLHLIDMPAVKEFLGRDNQQPFFLVAASNNSHFPWNKGDASQYKAEQLTVPDYLVDTPETRQALVSYYAEVSELDRQLGEIDGYVKEEGLYEDTIFIYTSEQGAMFPRAKWTLYDMGIKTALVVRWPGHIEAGTVSNALVHYVDVVPTLRGIVDSTTPHDMDGESFLEVLTEGKQEHREYVFGVHTNNGACNANLYPSRSVRSKKYKLIVNYNHNEEYSNNLTASNKGDYYESWRELAKSGDKLAYKKYWQYRKRPQFELYDMENDSFEQANLADIADYKLIKEELLTTLNHWMTEQGDTPMDKERSAEDRLTEETIEKISRDECKVFSYQS